MTSRINQENDLAQRIVNVFNKKIDHIEYIEFERFHKIHESLYKVIKLWQGSGAVFINGARCTDPQAIRKQYQINDLLNDISIYLIRFSPADDKVDPQDDSYW